MRSFLILILVHFLAGPSFGQYPFERYPKIASVRYQDWKEQLRTETVREFGISVQKFFPGGATVNVNIRSDADKDSSFITISKNGRVLQVFRDPYDVGSVGGSVPGDLFTEDINADGLRDLKILVPSLGCGAYNYYLRVIYLLQKRDGTFAKAAFNDLMIEFENRPERDVDGDGRFEIITQSFQSFGSHNYWVFNVYHFNGLRLVNVNKAVGYPIMVQILNRENYDITRKVSRASMRRFGRTLPDEYTLK